MASGAACLCAFRPVQTGPVLLFAAEDALHLVRERLAGIARAAAVPFDTLAVHVITAPSLRLDVAEDQRRLAATVAGLRPKLLILDPFVRLHRIDENVAAEVAPLLAYLRDLQRRFATAVLLVFHARKGAAHVRAGQALRGSSELHAVGDSNLYLRRRGDALLLSIEHRAAPSVDGIALALRADGDALALQVVEAPSPHAPLGADGPGERIEQALAAASGPLTLRALRRACRMRMSSLCDTLALLLAERRVLRSAAGYQLADP